MTDSKKPLPNVRPKKAAAAPARATVEVAHAAYQPSKAELEADLRVDATFDEAVEALTWPVNIRHVSRPKRTGD